ncbi:MAG: nitroreductase family protein [Lachnospiraceae bacterium]|nr:nitroreductase family protein [Lachnospiraceae bacterium]
MNTLEAIARRKSICSYTGERISEEEMAAILKAANEAPVGMGKYDSLHLTRVENEEMLKELDGAAAKLFGRPGIHPLYGAPTLILVSSKSQNGSLSNVEYSNAAIVAHNMALAATELGVGVCHIWGAVAALNADPELVEKLSLPEGFVPCCGVILGKTEQAYEERTSREGHIGITELL